jgi:hypothetical protein
LWVTAGKTYLNPPGAIYKMMNEIIFMIFALPEGGYIARALGESIFTEADNMEELHTQIHDAVYCHFDEVDIPLCVRTFTSHKTEMLF